MKHIAMLVLILLCGAWLENTAGAGEARMAAPELLLKNADAQKALALANEWRWTRKEITSYIDTQAVVFKFPDGKIIRIPLPADRVMVAVAPYINQTHG